MRVFYCDQFVLPLPSQHRFPMSKYARLRERLLATGVLRPDWLEVPSAATDAQLRRVHTAEYVSRVVDGELSAADVRRIGFPWSRELVERSRRSVGGTVAAATAALSDGVSVNLAGGTHHSFADRGEGYCVFNDVAVAVRTLQAERGVARLAIIDCDVHQGNGTAAIFAADSDVFTLSLHGRSNFPFRKEISDLDVALDDGTGDGDYLVELERALDALFDRFAADAAIYVSGADPYVGDRLGKLSLSKGGLRQRDRTVLRRCARSGVPVAVVMAGGYSGKIEDIVDIHAATVEVALEVARERPPSTRCAVK